VRCSAQHVAMRGGILYSCAENLSVGFPEQATQIHFQAKLYMSELERRRRASPISVVQATISTLMLISGLLLPSLGL